MIPGGEGRRSWRGLRWKVTTLLAVLPLVCVVLVPLRAHGAAGQTHAVALLVIDADSYLVDTALESLDLPGGITVRFFLHHDLESDPAARRFVAEADVVIVDVMGPELTAWLLAHVDPAAKRVYALRGSRDDDGLRRRGLVFDEAVKVYFDHLCAANIRNLIRRVVHQEIDPAVAYAPVKPMPELGIFHPDGGVFESPEAYRGWYRTRKGFREANPWIGIMFFASNLIEGQRRPFVDTIGALEGAGFNVMACFGRDRAVIETLFLDARRRARVELVLAFSLKFYSAIDDDLRRALEDLDVPVLDAINLYAGTIADWRRDPVGIPPRDIVWSIAVPEMSGVGEPTPLAGKVAVKGAAAGKTVFRYEAIPETVQRIVPRIKGWLRLRQKANPDKRLALIYYNHSQGKQNVGASYLNVFQSLETILARLQQEGYRTGDGLQLTAADLKTAILRSGRNIGSWAPGELDRLLAAGEVVRLPLSTYRAWFDQLPEAFRRAVVDQWGPPDAARIMVTDGQFIIPAVVRGSLVLLPEPARGWADEPMKLYHDTTLFPHHQYIAAYLWLKHGFGADAMVHLGTHATHEWLPGKQAGLAPADPPEVLLADLPNLYPYIVDNIGEGLQAKRRGRGIVVDHLIPPLRPSGLYRGYAELLETIQAYHQAAGMGSETVETHLARIEARIRETGIDKDLHTTGGRDHFEDDAIAGHADDHRRGAEPPGQAHDPGGRQTGPDGRRVVDEALIHDLEHYLMEIKETLMPYGLHTFGRSPGGAALEETAAAVAAAHPGRTPAFVAEALESSGPRELDRLVAGLEGRYVPPGEGNDPVRNIQSIPTGNNFYGFSPDKIPSPAAWELGRQAARQIVAKHLAEKGAYPEKVAVVLWATETIRNEGVNESTILHLLGLYPQRDPSGRVTGIQVVPGQALGRPRIDVLINPSGLYRDLFPHMLHFLDRAVRTAAVQTDIANLVADNTRKMEAHLRREGLSEDAARQLAAVRIFSEPPGSYGNGVSEMASASSFWDSDQDIVTVYRNRTGFAFGGGLWGAPAPAALRLNLAAVDVAVHSRSSQLYGLLDNDDVFQYLGGLSLAVARERGQVPDTLITDQRTPGQAKVEDVARTLGREMRARYFNPRWIAGMQAEDYAGAREMAHFADYLWGWQVTVPTAVDAAKWGQAYAVYVEDRYGMDLKAFFNRHNPWAYQSLTARMLEAVRKDYWPADAAVTRKLAVDYAVNVVDKGVACCDHTCNNPFLNQMVVNIISLPGVVSPEIVEQFKLAVARAASQPLADQAARHKALLEHLEARPPVPGAQAAADDNAMTAPRTTTAAGADEPAAEAAEPVEGYKLENVASDDDRSRVTSSGIQWTAALFVLLVIGLFVWGLRRQTGKASDGS